MSLIRFLLPLVFLLSACSTADNSEPPAVLTPIEAPEFVKELWSFDTGQGVVKKYVDMQPFTYGQKIYSIDTTGLLLRLDVKNGSVDWRFETKLAATAGLSGDDKRLVATSRNGEVALYDYDNKGVKLRWKQQLSGEIRTRTVLSGEQVFVRAVDGKLIALSAADGKPIWTVTRRVPALSLTGNSYPIVTDKLVISGFDSGKLVAFNRETGSTVWEHTVTTPKGRTEIERLVDLDGQFVLLDNIIYISSFQGDLIAITLSSGQVLWTRKFSSFQAMDADKEALYLTDDKSHVWSIDRRTGSAFWKQDALNARKLTAPRISGDRLVVADLEGYIHWMDKLDGKIVARQQSAEIRYISQPQTIGSTLIVMDMSGQLSAFNHQKKTVKPNTPFFFE